MRTEKSVARRIDRLARRAHAFHRFAHHPLCDVYESEVIRLGKRTRLCRGCAYLYGGAAAGALSGAVLRPPAGWVPAMLGLGVAWLWFSVERRAGAPATSSRPRKHSSADLESPKRFDAGHANAKVLTRTLPGALLGFAFTQAAQRSATVWPQVAAIAALLVLLVVVRRYRARGPNRSACLRCPEFSTDRTCRGFAPIVRRERAFMRVAAHWMAEAAEGRARARRRAPL